MTHETTKNTHDNNYFGEVNNKEIYKVFVIYIFLNLGLHVFTFNIKTLKKNNNNITKRNIKCILTKTFLYYILYIFCTCILTQIITNCPHNKEERHLHLGLIYLQVGQPRVILCLSCISTLLHLSHRATASILFLKR